MIYEYRCAECGWLTVDRWNSITLQVEDDGVVAVDFLRAEPFGGLPTRRTLTGVGI